jgi:uncharacterized membrane protein YkgB
MICKLNFDQMELIAGGGKVSSFCAGFGAVSAVYGIGVLANWWNPVGWAGGTAAAIVGAGCAIDALR